MTAMGLLFSLLTLHVWKYPLNTVLTLIATNLAVCAALVYVGGVPGVPSVPPTLWPFFAFVLAFVAGVL